MATRWAIRARPAAAAALLCASMAPLPGQAEVKPHLAIGVGAGWVGGSSLWDVPAQTIRSVSKGPDVFHLRRDLGSGVSLSGHLTYFRGEHFGVTGEFTFLGLTGSDECTVVQDGGDAGLLAACSAIAQSPSSVASTIIQGGIIIRPFGDAAIRSYVKGMAGIALTAGSTLAMRSFYNGRNVLTIYEDDNVGSTHPTWTLAVGAITALKPGYQVFFEARGSWLSEARVSGPTTAQGSVPASHSSIKGFPSIFVGFEIVLEQRRGRQF